MAGFVVAGGGEIPRPVCRIARSLTSAAQSASFHGSFGAVAEEGKAGKLGHCAGSPLVCESTSVAPHNPCASLTNPEERQFSRSLSTVLWELSSRERERDWASTLPGVWCLGSVDGSWVLEGFGS